MSFCHAIVGCGSIGPSHADAFSTLPNGYIKYTCDIIPEKAQNLARRFNIDRATVSFREILQDPEITSISLAVPHFLHTSMTLEALRAGKHVLVEKPFVMNPSEGAEVISMSRTSGLVVMPVSQHRFDNVVQAVHRLVSAKILGRLCMVRAHLECLRPSVYYSSSSWRGRWNTEGGSALINQGYHILDLLLWLAGPVSSINSVTAILRHSRVIETEDSIAATMVFQNKAIGVLSIGGAAGRQWDSYLELAGSEGVVAFDINFPNKVHRLELNNKAAEQSFYDHIKAQRLLPKNTSATQNYYGTHRPQAQAFVNHIAGKPAEGAASINEAQDVICLITDIYRCGHPNSNGNQDRGSRMNPGLVRDADREDVADTSTEIISRDLQESDIQDLCNVLRGGYLNAISGGHLEKFETEFSSFAGTRYSVAFSSGTAALHAAFWAAGVGPGSEVVMCDYGFHGAAAAVLTLGARVIPVDCLPTSLTMDSEDLRRVITSRTKAILVHNPWGVPADFSEIRRVAGDIPIISDASHAHGAIYLGQPLAKWADITCFSMGLQKLITGGELGAAATDNSELRDRMMIYGHVNRVPDSLLSNSWKGNAVGLKFRPHIAGLVLASAQIGRYQAKLKVMRETCMMIEESLKDYGLIPLAVPPDSMRVYWKIVSRLDRQKFEGIETGRVESALRAGQIPIEANYYWPVLQKHTIFDWPQYRNLIQHRDCPVAEAEAPRTITFPAPVDLVPEEFLRLKVAIQKVFNGIFSYSGNQ